MTTTYGAHRSTHRMLSVVLRSIIVALTLATAAIHASLGGMLFTLNAIAYATFAVAMIVPGPVGRIRWLVRMALIGFALTTILAWLLVGARFSVAYIDKAIEVALVGFVATELWLEDGSPLEIGRRIARSAVRTIGMLRRA
jgi:hypothetical protein